MPGISVVLCFRGDLDEAREKTGWIVSRETDDLPKDQVIRATIESVLENGNDAVFGAVFWFIVAGAPGVVLFRLANTLDAMWGYKNDKYIFFGRTAAYLDDALNWIPARWRPSLMHYRVTGVKACTVGKPRLVITRVVTAELLWPQGPAH